MNAATILLLAFAPLMVAAAAYMLAEFFDWLDRVIDGRGWLE